LPADGDWRARLFKLWRYPGLLAIKAVRVTRPGGFLFCPVVPLVPLRLNAMP
jgi:hypothetical protein